MANIRPSRVAEQMKKEITDILYNELKDPRIGFVTVTGVEVSNDLQHAKVFTSIMGSEEEKARSLQALERAAGFIRSEIGRRIRLRHTPEIVFKLDTSIDHSQRILDVIRELHKEKGEGP
ncbi:MAG: 30S ribosome-binding factor RbfA [Alicyclobacillaceae bacterium]|nr:30S ribosome-binding factor RbfA [Alicyclobacillaceae bacterium]